MNKKIFKKFTITFIALVLVMSSTTAFAANGMGNFMNPNAFSNNNQNPQNFGTGWGKHSTGLDGNIGNMENKTKNMESNFLGNMVSQVNGMGFQYSNINNNIIQKLVEYLDIDISDLEIDETIDEIIDELDDLSSDQLEKAADLLNIDTDDLDDDEIIEEIKDAFEDILDNEYNNDTLEKVSDLLDINIDDLDDDEIVDEINDKLDDLSVYKLLQIAHILNIDSSDLTSDEIIDAIENELADLE